MDRCSVSLQAICSEFQKYIVRYKIKGTYLAINLNRLIRDWLAQPDRRERLKLETMPAYEQIALIAAIEASYRKRWQAKAKTSRARTVKRKKLADDKDRQLSLKL